MSASRLGECESDQARAKQNKTCNGHGEKAFGSEFIPHGTTYRVSLARMERLSRRTVKEFPSIEPISWRTDVLMQHSPEPSLEEADA